MAGLLAASKKLCMLEGDFKNSRVVSIERGYHPKSVHYTCAGLVQTQDVRVESSGYAELSFKFFELLRKVEFVILTGQVVENAVKLDSLRGALCHQWEDLADLEALIQEKACCFNRVSKEST